MKSYKNLYQKLCSFNNLFNAYKKARKGKTKRCYVLEFNKNLKSNLDRLQYELKNQTYNPRKLTKFIIRDPKTRKICKADFRDRIVHHTLVNVLQPIYESIFIYDSYASRKNKGHHKALERFDYFKRKVSNNGKKLKGVKDNNYVCGYVLKADIEHYFDNVDHTRLTEIINKKIKDLNIIWLINQILKNYETYHTENRKFSVSQTFGAQKVRDGKGVPLGNYTSQFFANIYLNELDYFVKHKLKAKYYIRYVDDFVILHNSKEQLAIWKEEIDNFLINELLLCLHLDKSKIIPIHKGAGFVGFRIFYYYKLLKKSNIKQTKFKLIDWSLNKNSLDKDKLVEKIKGWFAHAKHGDSYNLRYKLIKEFNKILDLELKL